jgi:hypothetical protein
MGLACHVGELYARGTVSVACAENETRELVGRERRRGRDGGPLLNLLWDGSVADEGGSGGGVVEGDDLGELGLLVLESGRCRGRC